MRPPPQGHPTHPTAGPDRFVSGGPAGLIPLAAGATVALQPATALAQQTDLITMVSGMPTIAQILAGAILYGGPAARLAMVALDQVVRVIDGEEPPPAEEETRWSDRLSAAIGTMEVHWGKTRDTAAIAAFAASLVFGDGPGAALTIAAIFSFVNHVDRVHRVDIGLIRRQAAAGQFLTPAGLRRQMARALGPAAASLPGRFPEKDVVGTEYPRHADDATPKESVWYDLKILWRTIKFLGITLSLHVSVEGWRKTISGFLMTLRKKQRAPVSGRYLQVADVVKRQWALQVAEARRGNLEIGGIELLDQIRAQDPRALFVMIGVPHSAIWPDFELWAGLPRALFVAAYENFHQDLLARLSGLAWSLDVTALPMVSRTNRQLNRRLFADVVTNMRGHQIIPLFFPTGGRVPEAYDDEGNFDRPGLYSNVNNGDNPTQYLQFGGTLNIAFAALDDEHTASVYIPIVTIEGAGEAMPKKSRAFPFLQRMRRGKTVRFRIAEVVEITREEAKRQNRKNLEGRITERVKELTGINTFLKEVAAQWADDLGYADDTAAKLAAWADRDERWYTLLDRIRSIHPKVPTKDKKGSARESFKERLFDILNRGDDPSLVDSEQMNLLREVSQTVKKTQHKRYA